MNDSTRSPGRPRLYASSSEKALAFRQRLVAGGYLRKEVLVSADVAERLAGIAKTHEVSTVDVASALLEHGLAAFEQQSSVLQPARAASLNGAASAFGAMNVVGASAGPVLSASPGFALSAPSSTAVNPILDFFQRRKDSLNGPQQP